MPSTQLKDWALRNITKTKIIRLNATILYLFFELTSPVCSRTIKWPRLSKKTNANPKKATVDIMWSTGFVRLVNRNRANKLAKHNVPANLRPLMKLIININCISKYDN